MMLGSTMIRLAAFSLFFAACSGATAPRPAVAPPVESAAPPRTLNVLLVGEPRGLTAWKETTTGGVFNVHETITDGLMATGANSETLPRLSEIPAVERGTWTLKPDGTMDSTYKLHPAARWHDGT